MEKISGSEAVIKCLLEEGVDILYGYPGGAIMPVYDELFKYQDKIHHVLTRHEQGATHAAQGYARISGKVGVAIATSGPGATNLVTGLADAQIDSTPIVCITGQVASHLLGSDAFQETDIIGISTPITKWNHQITKAEEIPTVLAKAFYIAKSGRPGPVLIDITKDAQFETFDFRYEKVSGIRSYKPVPDLENSMVEKAAELINNAKKPLIVWGQGVILGSAENEFIKLIEKTGIPAAWTILGASAIPTSHPLNVGMLGMHGNYAPNKLTNECDVLIAIGMRFDDRVTGNTKTYSPNSKKIHIEVDPSEINKNVKVDLALNGDLKFILNNLVPKVSKKENTAWFDQISSWQNESASRDIINMDTEILYGAQVISDLWKETNGDAIIVSDVGQHQMLEAQYYKHDEPNTLLTSGGLGTMGFSLPAAIGASFANRNKEIWVIVGDGSIQMTITELATAVQENTNIKVAIINNGYLGMVRQWQQLFYDSRYSETPISSPDYVKLSEAYGLKGIRVCSRKEIPDAIKKVKEINGPSMIEFVVEQHDMVYPMVPAGANLDEMISRPVHEQFEDAEM